MLRLAARYADQWDTFPGIAGTATDGVTESIAERVVRFEAACREAGRDPAAVRRSTWAGGQVAADPDAYVEFVRGHRDLGFTDFMTEHPGAANVASLRRIAREVIPSLRAEVSDRA